VKKKRKICEREMTVKKKIQERTLPIIKEVVKTILLTIFYCNHEKNQGG
jgi:hypothetical protein